MRGSVYNGFSILLPPKCRKALLDHILYRFRIAQIMECIQAQGAVIRPEKGLYFFRLQHVL